MVVCRCCGGNCDNGELVGGICPECIEEERKKNIRAESVSRMLNSQSSQMELRIRGMEHIVCSGYGEGRRCRK